MNGRWSRPASRQVNPWVVAVAVMFSSFMVFLDTSVVNVSLPHIAGNLSATIDESTWVLTSYLVANAVVLPLTGWLANPFGRKRLLMTSLTGSRWRRCCAGWRRSSRCWCSSASSRALTGGVMLPLSQAVMLEAFPRTSAARRWASGVGIVVAPILGPVIGGWLTDTYSWRWVFYINVPVGVPR